MRTIKFRAWDKKKNQWARELPFTVLTVLNNNAIFELYNDYYEWMQYTGLKDKNGKEIYEGDIVRGSNGDVFKCDDALAAYFGVPHDIPQLWEVIGNVYESPDLLK